MSHYVEGSDLGQKNIYAERFVGGISQCFQASVGILPQIAQGLFLPNSFHLLFILSFEAVVYNMRY
jgi:hypothetical protein